MIKCEKKPITNGILLSLKFPIRTYDIGIVEEQRNVRTKGNKKRLHSIVTAVMKSISIKDRSKIDIIFRLGENMLSGFLHLSIFEEIALWEWFI